MSYLDTNNKQALIFLLLKTLLYYVQRGRDIWTVEGPRLQAAAVRGGGRVHVHHLREDCHPGLCYFGRSKKTVE